MEVRSFLGFTGYYCRLIPKFAQVAWPLHKLMSGENAGKKKAAIKWDSRCQWAFDDLKALCTTAPILAYANFSKPFKLHTVAHGTGLGAVLYQTWEDGTKAVIAYASRNLSKAESHYPAYKLEFLALKWAVVEKFHEYLYRWTFDIHIDNNLLTYVLTITKLDAAAIAGSPAWPTTILDCTIRLAKPIQMQMPYWGYPGQDACLAIQALVLKSLLQLCRLCRRLLYRGQLAP